jgi:DNA repair exonuclease SbcCD ATPase subunit
MSIKKSDKKMIKAKKNINKKYDSDGDSIIKSTDKNNLTINQKITNDSESEPFDDFPDSVSYSDSEGESSESEKPKKVIKKKSKGLTLTKEDIENTINNVPYTILEKGKKIKKIFHIADVHLQNKEEHNEEYKIVIKRLCDQLKSDSDINDSVICILGDTWHSKNFIKSNGIMMLKHFFLEIGDIANVVIIHGNHDKTNEENFDIISAILNKGFSTKNKIHLLENGGHYEYHNILFNLTTMWAHNVTPCKIKTDLIKVNLFHGYLHGITLENGFQSTENGRFNQTDFTENGGQITLLGDIHRQMWLDSAKRIAYSGSLLQTSHGESMGDSHGFIKWNMEDLSSEFVPVKNDYCYLTLKLSKDGLQEYDKTIIPKNVRLKIMYKDLSDNKVDEKIEELKKDMNIVSVEKVCDMSQYTISIKDPNNEKKSIDNIKDNKTVKKIILDFIKNGEYDFTKEQNEKITKIIEDTLNEMDYDFNVKTKQVKLKKLQFENIFLYGKNNVINFDKLNNIVGLVARNHTGKSSVISTILYSIFGTHLTVNRFDCLKKGETSMKTSILLEVNGKNYTIERTGKIKSKTERELFTEVNVFENDVRINGQDKVETENMIRRIVGSMEDLLNLSMMVQENALNFIDMSEKDREELLCKLLKLDVFKELFNRIKKRSGQIQYVLRDTKQDIKKLNYEQKNKDYERLKEELDNLVKKEKETKKEYDAENKNMIELQVKVKEFENLKLSSKKVSEIVNGMDKIKKEVKAFEDQVKKNNLEISKKEKENDKLLKALSQYKDIEKENDEFENGKENRISEIQEQCDQLLTDKVNIKDDGTSEIKLNGLIKSIILTRKNNHIKIMGLQENITKIKDKLIKLVKIKNLDTNCDKYDESVISKDNISELIEKLKVEIKDYKIKLTKIKTHEFDKKCKFCMKNPVTQQKVFFEEAIKTAEASLIEETNKLETIEAEIIKLQKFKDTKEEYENNVKNNEINEKKINKLTNELNLIQNDDKMVSRDLEEVNRKLKEYLEQKDNIEKNKKIDIEVKKLKAEMNEIREEEFEKYADYLREKEEHETSIKNCEKIKLKNMTLEKEMKKSENELLKLTNEYDKYDDLSDKIKESKTINEKFKKVKEKTDEFGELLCEVKDEIDNITREFRNVEYDIKRYNEYNEKIKENNNEKDCYDKLVKILGKNNGIVHEIMTNSILPSLENMINYILSNVSDYKLKFVYENNAIKVFKIQGNETVNASLLSGYEKFMAGVSLRLAISKVNNFLKTDFFVIDEGFKCCDSYSAQNLKTLFEYIRANYHFCLCISHDDLIKDNFDMQIGIDHKDGTSKISVV